MSFQSVLHENIFSARWFMLDTDFILCQPDYQVVRQIKPMIAHAGAAFYL
jgi:hypothetical protein